MMDEHIADAIQEISDTIQSLQAQIDMLKALDISKPLTEEEWHQICETPLRGSELMATFVRNIFPDATDIVVHCNYVYFNLLGFRIQIPTYQACGINVDTSWYIRCEGSVCSFEEYLSDRDLRIYRYFEAEDNKADWKTLARLRVNRPEWLLPFSWFLKYKWKNPHRAEWDEHFREKRAAYDAMIARRAKSKQESHAMAVRLHDELLPIIDSFSVVHNPYNSSAGQYTIHQILEWEGLS